MPTHTPRRTIQVLSETPNRMQPLKISVRRTIKKKSSKFPGGKTAAKAWEDFLVPVANFTECNCCDGTGLSFAKDGCNECKACAGSGRLIEVDSDDELFGD